MRAGPFGYGRRVWSDAEDTIIGGDLTAALAYLTPAGGAVVTAVAPVGLRDRDRGTVYFTTSLGFGRKLDRIKANPRMALAYHAREHGFASEPLFVLVQGEASYDADPDRATLTELVQPASTRFLGPPRRGLFWDRWLSAYYADRVLVTVRVRRVISWPDLASEGEPSVAGEPLPGGEPESQAPPANGTGPRVDVERAARRMRKLPHVLLGYAGADGLPMVVPVGRGRRRSRRHRAQRPHAAGRAPRGHARAPLRGEADRAGEPPVHRLGGGRALRTAHRRRVPRAREQDAAAARQRLHGPAGPQAGARARPRLGHEVGAGCTTT
jgi:hypothetical protein